MKLIVLDAKRSSKVMIVLDLTKKNIVQTEITKLDIVVMDVEKFTVVMLVIKVIKRNIVEKGVLIKYYLNKIINKTKFIPAILQNTPDLFHS